MARQISWVEGHRLIENVGREDHLARRVTTERMRLGLSQEKLAEAMTAAGCPVPQSAISKIENPARGGRRAITVEEAIAFSKVFGIPLGELLLPANALDHVQALQALADGPDLLKAVDRARWAVEAAWETLARVAREDPVWLETLSKAQAAAEIAAAANPEDSYRVMFLRGISRPGYSPKKKSGAFGDFAGQRLGVALEEWAPYGVGEPDADGLYPDYRVPSHLTPKNLAAEQPETGEA